MALMYLKQILSGGAALQRKPLVLLMEGGRLVEKLVWSE